MVPRIELTWPHAVDHSAVGVELAGAGAGRIYVVDLDAGPAGAPQNIEMLHRILRGVTVPVMFEGGINLVHTAELVLGLGVESVVVGGGLTKTDLSARHFISKFGDRIVGRIDSRQDPLLRAERLKEEGCSSVVMATADDPAAARRAVRELGITVYAEPAGGLRNLSEAAFVGLEVIVSAQDFLARYEPDPI